jgi:glutathione synthase/RimK-type ligase-like ATP-grasp enzyme
MKYDIIILTDSRYEKPVKTDWYIDQVLLEDGLVQKALEAKGLKVIRKDWASENFDWTSTQYAIFRTTWDYFDRFDEFFQWFKKTQGVLTFINSPEIIYWNLDKHYLFDLDKKGINIPKTVFIEQGEKRTLKELFTKQAWEKAILKPAIAGAARETYLIESKDAENYEVKLQELISKEAMLFQEFQENIQSHGEMSLMMIAGNYTHAVLKKAKSGDFRVQDDFGGSVEIYTPTKDEISFAEKAINACPHQPLYARVDIFYDNEKQLALGELELIEPELWFRNCPEAANRLAEVVYKFILSNNQ